ncbi:hypothetical protein ACSBR2_005460 [Camellia fascicularis]
MQKCLSPFTLALMLQYRYEAIDWLIDWVILFSVLLTIALGVIAEGKVTIALGVIAEGKIFPE